MATQRIYTVTDGKVTQLVQASNQAQALRYVAGKRYSVQAAKPVDVAKLMSSGIQLEMAGPDFDAETPALPGMQFGEELGA